MVSKRKIWTVECWIFPNNQALGQSWFSFRTQETSAFSKFYLLQKNQRILWLAGKFKKKKKKLKYLSKYIHVQLCSSQDYHIFDYHKITYFFNLLNFISYWTNGRSKVIKLSSKKLAEEEVPNCSFHHWSTMLSWKSISSGTREGKS